MRERERMRDNAKLSRHPSSSFIHHQCPPKRHIWRKCRVCCASSSSPSVGWRHRLYVSIHPSSTTLVTHFVVVAAAGGLPPNVVCFFQLHYIRRCRWDQHLLEYDDINSLPSSSLFILKASSLSKDLYPDKSESIMYHHRATASSFLLFITIRGVVHYSRCKQLGWTGHWKATPPRAYHTHPHTHTKEMKRYNFIKPTNKKKVRFRCSPHLESECGKEGERERDTRNN